MISLSGLLAVTHFCTQLWTVDRARSTSKPSQTEIISESDHLRNWSWILSRISSHGVCSRSTKSNWVSMRDPLKRASQVINITDITASLLQILSPLTEERRCISLILPVISVNAAYSRDTRQDFDLKIASYETTQRPIQTGSYRCQLISLEFGIEKILEMKYALRRASE